MTRDAEGPPQSLRIAVTRHLGLIEAKWHMLRGGFTNRTWRVSAVQSVDTNAGAFDVVVKLYRAGAETPLFPNDPIAEAAVLHSLSKAGLAPAPRGLLTGDFGTALVYDYQHGQTWSGDVRALSDVLARVHRAEAPEDLRHLTSGSVALLNQAEAILAACNSSTGNVEQLIKEASDGQHVDPIANPSLIHGDPVATNIVETADGLTLIDWQCPALGDPCEDLAIVLSPFMQRRYLGRHLSAAENTEVLMAYPEQKVADRYRRLARFFHLRMAAYACWCAENGRGGTSDDIADELRAAQASG